MRCYPHFTLTRGRSPGFGSMTTNYSPYSDSLSLRLRLSRLNLARHHHSPVHSTKGTPSHPKMLRLLVGTRFQVLFHSAPAVLFTFPSRYYPLSVAREYLALGGGPPGFPRGSSCPAVLGFTHHRAISLSYTGLSPSMAGLPMPFYYRDGFLLCEGFAVPSMYAPLPHPCNGCNLSHKAGLGYSAFARHY
jgi:hypothetical protein